MNRAVRSFLLTIPFLALFLCLSLLTHSTLFAQDQSLYWERYDVEIEVRPDGTFRVIEHNQINFTSGTFRFGARSIPTERLVGIDELKVTFDGTPFTLNASGELPGTFETASNGGNLDVRYFFPEPISGPHQIDIEYVVRGGVRYYEDGDQLFWKAVHSDRPATIEASRVTVYLPAGVAADQIRAEAYDTEANVTVSPDGRTLTFDALSSISPGQELEIRVQFPHGVVSGSAPAWQAQADLEDIEAEARAARAESINLLAGGSSIILLIGGFISVIMLWWRGGRDPTVELAADYLTEPPDDLPAGIVGTLIDESADQQDIMATLLDLARKGAIRIEETQAAQTGWFNKKEGEFLYTLQDRSKATSKGELTLIEEFFGSRQRRRLEDLHQKFYSSIPKIKQALYEDVTERELFEQNPDQVRQNYTGGGILLMVLSGVLFFALLFNMETLLAEALLCLPLALGLTGGALTIMSRVMPRKTKVGSETASKWQAFRRYLQNLEKYGALEEKKEIWDQYLPYAVAFGLEKRYIKQFAQANAPVPRWYTPYGYSHGPYYRGGHHNQSGNWSDNAEIRGGQVRDSFPGSQDGGGLQGASDSLGRGIQGMSDGLASMLTVTANTLTSTPPSQSSGGGGGGWSGGGGFGGGGGGGGSSSFG